MASRVLPNPLTLAALQARRDELQAQMAPDQALINELNDVNTRIGNILLLPTVVKPNAPVEKYAAEFSGLKRADRERLWQNLAETLVEIDRLLRISPDDVGLARDKARVRAQMQGLQLLTATTSRTQLPKYIKKYVGLSAAARQHLRRTLTTKYPSPDTSLKLQALDKVKTLYLEQEEQHLAELRVTRRVLSAQLADAGVDDRQRDELVQQLDAVTTEMRQLIETVSKRA